MRRVSRWNAALQDASVTEFRRLIADGYKDQVRNAMKAGRSLAKLMRDGHVTITGIDDVQLERFRRRFTVAENCKGVMYAVATGKLTDTMFQERLDRRFPDYTRLDGRVHVQERCALCGKKICLCITERRTL
jgi:hypothetical protein